MKNFLISLALMFSTLSMANALEYNKVYTGTDAQGKQCSIQFFQPLPGNSYDWYHIRIGSYTNSFTDHANNYNEPCDFYSKTATQTIMRELSWDESGFVSQLTVNEQNGSFTLDRGSEAFISKTLACAKFLISRQTQTCYNLVSK